MIIISILSIIVAISLQHVNNPLASQATRDPISPILFARITSIFFIYSAILNSNVLYIDNIESGIGIYNGYYQVTSISLSIEIFMYLIGALILMPWYPSIYSITEIFSSSPAMSEGRGELVGIGEVVSTPSRRGHTAKWENTTIFNSESLKVSDKTSRFPMAETDSRRSSSSSRTLTISPQEPVDFSAEYSLILLFTILGGSLLISSSDLISMYLSIELQSFAVYILTSLNRNSETSTSAGLKYFLLGGLSSCLILLGCALVYSYTGITNLDSIYSLVSVPSIWLPELSLGIDPLSNVSGGRGFLLGIVLIVIGFLFKIAGAPFHHWSPDVYDDSSTIVTTWLTIMPKISIIIFLLELESGLFLPLSGSFGDPSMYNMSESDMTSLFQFVKEIYEVYPLQLTSPLNVNVIKSLLLFSSLLSLIIGTVVGLAQYKIKRLLAYSTISHVGFLLLALGINTEQSIESLIFYILQYSITNLNTFLILLVFGYTFNTFLLDLSKTNNLTLSSALWSNKEQHSFSRSDKWNQKSKSNSLPVHISEGFEESHTIQSNSMDIKYISQLKAQFIYNPILSLSLAICLFSMAGIPPLLGFFAKQQVLYSATHSGYFFLSIVAILVSVISASYYLQIIKVIHFPSYKYFGLINKENDELPTQTENSNGDDRGHIMNSDGLNKTPSTIVPSLINLKRPLLSYLLLPSYQPPRRGGGDKVGNTLDLARGKEIQLTNDVIQITNVHSMTISTLTLTILLFILNPSLILNSTHLMALTIFNS